MTQPLLFTPLHLRGVTSPNRCVLSPMVQHKAVNGQVNDYHLVHLGQFALGQAAEKRLSGQDLRDGMARFQDQHVLPELLEK